MNERQQILKMIEEGKISADEGLKLLNQLEKPEQDVMSLEVEDTKFPIIIEDKNSTNKNYSKFRIKIKSSDGKINVNLWIPISLLKFASKFTGLIPANVQTKLGEQNIEIEPEQIKDILKELESGALENPEIINVTTTDENNVEIHVQIYFE